MPQRPSKAPRRHVAGSAAAREWYAVTDDGDSALRIAPGLTLGEHPDGALALNARAPEARWVRVEVGDGAAFLSALESRRLVDPDGGVLERVPLSEGLCVELPHSLLRISHSIRAPAATGPTVAVEPVEREPEPEPGPEPERNPAPESKPVVDPHPAPAGADPRAQPDLGLRPSVALALGVGVVCVALLTWWGLAPGRAKPDEPATEGIERSPTAPAGADRRAEPAAAIAAIRLAPLPLRLLPVPADVAAEPDTVLPAERSAESAPAAPADPRLETARQYFEAGQITYPPGDNAVAMALTVLDDHPGHAGAMELLGRCTTYLLDQARAQRAAGQDFAARNTLEEVLGFNPDHAEARRLWADWVGTPR